MGFAIFNLSQWGLPVTKYLRNLTIVATYLNELRLYGGRMDALIVEEGFDSFCYDHVVPEVLTADMCRRNDSIAC